jgi:hypothetical protein
MLEKPRLQGIGTPFHQNCITEGEAGQAAVKKGHGNREAVGLLISPSSQKLNGSDIHISSSVLEEDQSYSA